MYTILVNKDNELVTTVKERIMQRSKLVDKLHFLVEPTYNNVDIAQCTVLLEYLLPISKEYRTEILVASEELYKETHLEYVLPFDTKLTKEHGDIELQLSFVYSGLDEDGMTVQHVRKTSPTTIKIIPISAWSDIIADSALTALDQRIIQTQAMIEAANEMVNYLDGIKVDNIEFDITTKTLQLMSNGNPVGDKVSIRGVCDGITELHVDEDGNLIAIYNNGKKEVVGKTGPDCTGIYIPSIEGDIMTFTLSESTTEETLSFDIDKSNDWSEIDGVESKSNYVWKEL